MRNAATAKEYRKQTWCTQVPITSMVNEEHIYYPSQDRVLQCFSGHETPLVVSYETKATTTFATLNEGASVAHAFLG